MTLLVSFPEVRGWLDAHGGATWELLVPDATLAADTSDGSPRHAVLRAWPDSQTVDEWVRFEFGWVIGSWEWEPAELAVAWPTVASLTRAGRLGPCSSVDTDAGRLRAYCQTWEARRTLGALRRAGIAESARFVTWTEAVGRTKVQVGRVTLRSGAGSTMCAPVSAVPARAAS